MKQTITTRKIVITALLAALTVAGSALRVTMPIGIAGNTSFHLGNILCALSGLLLGPWFGGLAAGMGSFLYDLLSGYYIVDSFITFLTKGAYGLVAGLVFLPLMKRNGHAHLKATLACVAGAITYAALYLLKSYFKAIIVHSLTPAAALITLAEKLPATIFNGVIAILFAPILYTSIRAALKRNHLEF